MRCIPLDGSLSSGLDRRQNLDRQSTGTQWLGDGILDGVVDADAAHRGHRVGGIAVSIECHHDATMAGEAAGTGDTGLKGGVSSSLDTPGSGAYGVKCT